LWHTDHSQELEERISRFLGTEDTILYRLCFFLEKAAEESRSVVACQRNA
jgi:7-keto-8-aminopelargonate synthetase-like enzyme